MPVEFVPAPWAFLIDTDSYSGNFERELCAWITGQVGECGVGDGLAESARAYLPNDLVRWFEFHTGHVADDHGCSRPAAIWPTPGFFNDGFGNQWPEDADPEEVRAKYLKTVREYFGEQIQRCQNHLDEGKDIKAWTQEQDSYKNRMAQAEAAETPHHESYQSVAVFLNLQPSPEILELMKERALSYRKKLHRMAKFSNESDFKILGFRLVKMELKETVEWEEKNAG